MRSFDCKIILKSIGGVVQGITLTCIGFVPHISVHPLIAAVAVSAIFTGLFSCIVDFVDIQTLVTVRISHSFLTFIQRGMELSLGLREGVVT